ncbi:YceD family protein [Desulfocurvus sp. DL9XJH121]
MRTLWIDISDIPATGREFSFSDSEIWSAPAREFAMGLEFDAPIEAVLTVYPQEDSCLVRGRLAGAVSAPCARCTKPASVSLDAEFEAFATLTPEDETEPVLLREENGRLELDAGSILWEQFVLALPGKPLCSPACKGLCPVCGADLNEETCTCADQGGDPRLAVLRGLKIPDKN